MKKFLITTILLLVFLISSSFAKDNKTNVKEKPSTLPTDNGLPYFITTAVYPMDKGSYEIITQPQYNNGKGETVHYLLVSTSYGVTESWQVYFNILPYVILQETGMRSSGLGDIDLGSQYSWMYINNSTLSTAFLLNIHVPLADINKDLTDGFLRYEPYLIFAKDFIHSTWRTQFFSQIGLSIVQRLKSPGIEEEPPAAHSFILNTGVAARFEKINYSLEFNFFTNSWNNGGQDDDFYITPGVYFQIKKNIAIGLGVPIGLSKDTDNFAIIGNILVDIYPPSSDTDKKIANIDKKSKNITTINKKRIKKSS